MARRITVTMIVLLTLLLSGCGFHLRGEGADHIALGSIHVTATDAHGEMQRALEQALREAGVKLVDAASAPYTVKLLSERRTRRSVATTSDVRVAEYGLKLEVHFELTDQAGKTVIAPTSLSTQRIYRFDNSSLVGNSEQEDLLNREMRRDIASQIIRRIDATLRAGGGAAG